MGRRRTLGYIQNEWTCPNCNTRNKGGIKTCENCGAPQPENVQFDLPSEQNFVKDESSIKAAQATADIHCGFCGTRNLAGAETCSQCGGNLKEGKVREAGRIMQTPPPSQQPKTVLCKNCGTENPGESSVCSKCGSPLPKFQQPMTPPVSPMPGGISPVAPSTGKNTNNKRNLVILGVIFACLAIICVAVFGLFILPSSSVQATVTGVHWQTTVPVQEVQAVRYTDEKGSPPPAAYDESCRNESHDICEQKTIDKGNGYSEVVEECHTVTDQYCSYTMDEWKTIQTYNLDGNDLQPVYENPSVSSNQRVGDKSTDLTVTFWTNKGVKTYDPATISEYQQFTIGSTWTLKMNALGGVISVEP